jgi:predicted transposase YbfD/YdcC
MACMSSWVESLRQLVRDATGEEIVAIDGKTARGSGNAFSGCKPLHMVRAWATENRLVLGQEACDEKSNEITAIPRLLELIEIAGAIVTIDAMGCQTEIAEKVREKKADYVLNVKDNQPTLRQAIADEFDAAAKEAAEGEKPRFREHTTREQHHGRTEERAYYTMPAPKELKQSGKWKDLKSIGMVIRTRTVKGVQQVEVHYYITSLAPEVKRFARAVRSHWSIENRLHWMLDVEFAEDASRIRKGSSPQIASMLRQLALMILQHDTSMKEKTIRGKRKIVGWSNEALETLLLGTNRV